MQPSNVDEFEFYDCPSTSINRQTRLQAVQLPTSYSIIYQLSVSRANQYQVPTSYRSASINYQRVVTSYLSVIVELLLSYRSVSTSILQVFIEHLSNFYQRSYFATVRASQRILSVYLFI